MQLTHDDCVSRPLYASESLWLLSLCRDHDHAFNKRYTWIIYSARSCIWFRAPETLRHFISMHTKFKSTPHQQSLNHAVFGSALRQRSEQLKRKKKRISVELTLTYTHASAALAYTLTREYTQPPRVKQQKKKKRAHKHTKTLWETWCSVQQRHRMSATFNYSLTHMQPPVLSRRQPTKPNVSLCWLCMCICIAVCIFFLRLYSVRSLCVLCVMWVCVCLLCLYDCGEWLLCMCVRCVCVRVVYFRFGIVLNRNNVSFFSNFAWFRGGKEVKELCCTPDVLWTS